MSDRIQPDRTCPQCGGEVTRIRRLIEDRDAVLAAPVRRYRCAQAACGWEGLLVSRHPDAATRERARRHAARTRKSGRTRTGLALAAALGFAFAAGAAVKVYERLLPNPALAKLAPGPVVPFGASHDGKPIDPAHPLLVKVSAPVDPEPPDAAPVAGPVPAAVASGPRPLELRQDCAWGDPGRNPYKGTIEQALAGARLPPHIVARMTERIRSGKVTDRLEITNAGIRGVHEPREYSARSIGMTFGNTLCMNTRVNFVPGHMERADLYEIADASGETYSVMVPYACGNVSVLSARGEQGPVATTVDGRPLARKSSDLLAAIIPGGGFSRTTLPGSGGGGVTEGAPEGQVPEPGTLLNLSVGAALMAWFLRRRRRGPASPKADTGKPCSQPADEEMRP